ncbi:MAG: hypothetical protein MRZ79_27435 [Bacteroidia bacterium]|nr:hypothetical protein [Bacteroidia bacterium]
MKQILLIFAALLLIGTSPIHAQQDDSLQYRYFVGSTLFMLANFTPEPPSYYQLNFGYRFTPRDVVTVEAITWTYKGPLGRQYGPDFENPESDYPGKVRSLGAGLTYKRFIWKRVYGQIHSTALRQNYLDESGNKIQSGFQLFNTLRFGYQFRFLKNRIFLEPSIALTFFPIQTNMPESFQLQEDRFGNYFLGEPGLHFGFNF